MAKGSWNTEPQTRRAYWVKRPDKTRVFAPSLSRDMVEVLRARGCTLEPATQANRPDVRL